MLHKYINAFVDDINISLHDIKSVCHHLVNKAFKLFLLNLVLYVIPSDNT